MDFSPSPRVEELSARIGEFLDEHVYPVELEALQALDAEVGPGKPYPARGCGTCSCPTRSTAQG
jgi:hypothetical protein